MRYRPLSSVLVARLGLLSAIWIALTGSLSAGSAQLRVASEPPSAEVSLDGLPPETTPLTFTNLPPGTHRLDFRKSGFQDTLRSVRLSNGQKSAIEVRLEPLTGLLLVDSFPSDAEIVIQGIARGRTPTLLTDLPLGLHRIRFHAVGFAPQELEVNLADRTPRRLFAHLSSDSAFLVVDSDPPGAALLLNGATVGNTPCVIERVPSGKKQLEVNLAGYRPYHQELDLAIGSSNRVSAQLIAIPGALSIVSQPPKARIYLGGQFRGETPLALDSLPPGSLDLRADLKGFESISRKIDLQRGENQSVEFILVRNSGLAEIITEPAGVRVFIDGEDCGLTQSGASDLISNPLRIDLLSRGPHRLQLTRKGYYPVEKSFEVETDKSVSIQESLRKKFIADTRIRFLNEAGQEETKIGAVSQHQPNGDMELETKPGIYVKIPGTKIIGIDPVVLRE
jgi:hypothetical protein